jgi:radical SAM superfamily enzyme YgiQ (UPF0313 family)
VKILFVHPPLNPQGEITPPLGLCSLAGWLSFNGYEVSILDFDLLLKEHGEANRFVHIATILAERFLSFTPDLLCVTSMYSNSLYAAYIIRQAKKINPGIITVAGGSHFGAQGILSLQRIEELDFVLEGEAEVALPEFLEGMQTQDTGRAHNLVYRNASGIQHTEKTGLIDLDVLPNIWKEIGGIIDIQKYFNTIPGTSERKIMYVEAGRGCPFGCSFCATAPYWGRKYRVKKPELIVGEIEFLHKTYGYNSFILIHDLLPVNKKFISDLCDAMIDRHLPVEWMMNSRTDIDLIGYLPKLKAAGCWKFFYGIESASTRVQDAISKHLDRQVTINSLKTNLEHGILSTCSFVFGFPDETPEEISATIKLAALCKMNGAETVQFHRLRLFPPSKLSTENIETSFDLESLKIEYPFISITENEIKEIENDPVFFMGYHSPLSTGGTKEQLAQLEMFFHHCIALAPLTMSLCCEFYGNSLVHAFYNAVEQNGYLKRGDIEWQTDNLFGNWTAIRPLLYLLVVAEQVHTPWQSQLLKSVFDYEQTRLQFCTHSIGYEKWPHLIDKGDNWVAIRSAANISTLADLLINEEQITENLLQSEIIIISSKNGKNLAYSFGLELEPDLLKRNEEIMSLIE